MKEYIKPQAHINAFVSEDIITTSSATDDAMDNITARLAQGASIGTAVLESLR